MAGRRTGGSRWPHRAVPEAAGQNLRPSGDPPMAGSPDVFGLLEEMLDSGQTPEEVCHDCPELLPEVRQRWQAFCRIDAEVGALLPEQETPTDVGARTPVPHPAG